jgi:subtilisin-like proprotein convertase family protein
MNNGSGIAQNSNNTITVLNTGVATNIELYIDSLTHENPSDLTLFLTPPTGTPILLSHRNKINNYSPISGVSFSFSNKALPGTYLYNKSNSNDLHVNILKNSGVTPPSPYNSTYAYNFDHLFNSSVSGNWTLNVLDNDPGATGYIKGWNLVITYLPPETYIENT